MNRDVTEQYFNSVYDETFDSLARFVAVKVNDPALIPDILQETYTEFYRYVAKRGIAVVEHPRGLLFKICKRKLFRYYSFKQKVRDAVSLEQFSAEDETFSLLNTRETAAEPIDPVMRLEYERVLSIIAAYPVEIRKIFHLFYYEGLSHSDIAEVMGMNTSTVKNKIYRTLNEIREKEAGENER